MGFDAREIESSLRDYYDREGEERLARPLDPRRKALRDDLLEELEGRRCRVLEIGSGPGRDAAPVVHAGHDVTAVDLSWEHANRCRTRGAHVALATVRALPFPDGVFDAVWTMSVLMHVPDTAIAAAMHEVRRVLARGSAAYVGVWGGKDIEELDSPPQRRLELPPRLFSRRSDNRWTQMLERIGSIDRYELWPTDTPDFSYQVAVVRRA